MPTRRMEGLLQDFGDGQLQRWLDTQISAGTFDRANPVRTWPGTAMAGPRRLWQFAGAKRWVWSRDDEVQAFQEFASTGPGAAEAARLNVRITGLLMQGESPAGALFAVAGAGAAPGPLTGGFAIHSPPRR